MNPVGDIAGFPLYGPDEPWESVAAALEARELGDGMPLVPPTPERVEQMLTGIAEPERCATHLLPLMGELRADAVAYQCVMAGCRPEELPLVWSAARACAEPRFNLLGILTTTGTPAVAMVVHGEASEHLGINAAGNCLGPGNRANACVGRALNLTLRNIAGARPGVGDMATMGQPGKYAFCFAESPHPFAPGLPDRLGLPSAVSAVTVMGVSGTAEVLPRANDRTPADILAPVALAMASAIAVSSGGRWRTPAEQYFLLPPELADRLHARGWTLADAQGFLFDSAPIARLTLDGEDDDPQRRIADRADRIHVLVTGGPGVKMTHLPAWAGGTESVTVPVEAP